MKTPTQVIPELQDTEWWSSKRLLSAMRKAQRAAAVRHMQAGVPMVIFRDGKIQKIPAEQLLAEPYPQDDE